MKFIVSLLIGLVGSIGIIIADIFFVRWLFSLVPINDYAGLVKIVIVFVDIWLVAGLCIVPFILGTAIGTILETN